MELFNSCGEAAIVLEEADPRLHDWGGVRVASVIVKRGDGKEARFWLRVRIPDDPRGGVEGGCYCELTARGAGEKDVVREARSPWKKYD